MFVAAIAGRLSRGHGDKTAMDLLCSSTPDLRQAGREFFNEPLKQHVVRIVRSDHTSSSM